jgi:hypothetical protein
MSVKLHPVYVVNTPSGVRLIKAATPIVAIQYAMGEAGYTAEACSGPVLAHWLEKGLVIEAAPVPVARKVAA